MVPGIHRRIRDFEIALSGRIAQFDTRGFVAAHSKQWLRAAGSVFEPGDDERRILSAGVTRRGYGRVRRGDVTWTGTNLRNAVGCVTGMWIRPTRPPAHPEHEAG